MSWQRLPPRARWLFYLQAGLRWAMFWTPVSVAVGAAGVAFGSGMLGVALGSAVWVGSFLATLWLPNFEYEAFGYRWEENALHIVRGVLVRSVVSVPASRIQHVDVRQGPLERFLGLSHIDVHTASGGSADAFVPGLEDEAAEILRQDLLRRIERDDGV
jgi:membrane protein YdbS with pleckstrin-like domain